MGGFGQGTCSACKSKLVQGARTLGVQDFSFNRTERVSKERHGEKSPVFGLLKLGEAAFKVNNFFVYSTQNSFLHG